MSWRPAVALAAALLTLASVGPPPAGAAGPAADPPTTPGRVSHLHVVEVAGTTQAYRVTVAWRAGTDTSTYRVRASAADGSVLDAATVTATTWQADVVAAAGTAVTVAVTPYHDRVRGPASRLVTTLPDLTPPTGSFSVGRDRRDATLTWTRLADDVSPRRDIVRTVLWAHGTPRQAWRSGRGITHRYPGAGTWHPSVRLADAAGNAVELPAGAAVNGDPAPPTGASRRAPPPAGRA